MTYTSDLDTRTTRLRSVRPPSPQAILAGHGIAVAQPSAAAQEVLARYGLLPTWLTPRDEGPAVAPAPVPLEQPSSSIGTRDLAELVRTAPPYIPGVGRPVPPVAPLSAPRRRRGPLGWIADRVGMTLDLYRQRARRRLATGGGRSRRQGWGGAA